MAEIDHSEERNRLAAHYAEMTDTELIDLARDRSTLTDDALSVLESEFTRRGLPFEQSQPPAARDADDTKLVILRQFRDLPEAVAAKNALDAAGIPCFLADANTVRMDWLWSNALGGVKLWVREEDVPEATGLLDQDFSEAADQEQSAE